MRLSKKFYNRKTLTVARELLGKYLVRRIGRKTIVGMITETEAYCGFRDLASHASKGLTPRTKTMFGPAGHAYVYMIYGMYHCLNIVTEKEGYPAAVLIRSVAINDRQGTVVDGKKNKLLNGPGKVCREFKIDKKLNGVDMCRSGELWIEEHGGEIKPNQIKKGKRIGIDYAGKWKNKLWRFYI